MAIKVTLTFTISDEKRRALSYCENYYDIQPEAIAGKGQISETIRYAVKEYFDDLLREYREARLSIQLQKNLDELNRQKALAKKGKKWEKN